MGGGDLNTKKSWHPNTLKNQERVWAAERAAEQEKARIAELQRERAGEREREDLRTIGRSAGKLPATDSDKLSWMYNQPNKSGDTEDYLLGKTIDKNYERLIAEDKTAAPSKNHVEHEVIPFSIRQLRGAASDPVMETVDVARKLVEDPLAAIHRRELEARAQLLQNPLRLQKLHKLLKEDQQKQKSKKKSKKDKLDLDQLLAQKLSSLEGKKIDIASLLSKKKKKKSRADDKIYSGNSSLEDTHKKKKKKRKSSEGEDTQSFSKKRDLKTDEKPKKKKKGDHSTDKEEVNEKMRQKFEAFKSHMERKNSKIRSQNCDLETVKKSENKCRDSSSSEGRSKNNKEKREQMDFGWSKSNENKNQQSDLEDDSRKRRRGFNSEDNVRTQKNKRDDVKYGLSKNSREPGRKTKKMRHTSSHSDDDSPKRSSKHKCDGRSRSADRNSSRDLSKKALERPIEVKSRRHRSSSDRKLEQIESKSSSNKTDRKQEKQNQRRRSSSGESKHNRQSAAKNKSDRGQAPGRSGDSSESDSSVIEKVSSRQHASARRHDSNRPHASRDSDISSDSDGERRPKQFGLVSSDGRKLTTSRRDPEQKNATKSMAKTEEGWKRPKAEKLSEAEKEARRREMLSAAADREHERARNLSRHREQSAREEAAYVGASFDTEFATRQTAAVAGGSMEKRIRSNVYNIQRGSRHMDTNFARR